MLANISSREIISREDGFSGDFSVCKLYLLRFFERKTPMVVAGRGELFSLRALTVSHRSLIISGPSVLHSVMVTAQLFGRELRVLELLRVVPLSTDDIMPENLHLSACFRVLM